VVLEQRGILLEDLPQLVEHRAVSGRIGVDERQEPWQDRAALVVLRQHDGQRASLARDAPLLDEREEMLLFLLIVAAVHVLPEVACRVLHQTDRRGRGTREGLRDRLEDALGRLVIVHQQIRPGLGHRFLHDGVAPFDRIVTRVTLSPL
jgi:hypothetical protein